MDQVSLGQLQCLTVQCIPVHIDEHVSAFSLPIAFCVFHHPQVVMAQI